MHQIYCLFSHIGLDGHDILTFEEQKLLSEIRQHVDMRKDRMWEYVEVSLRDERCRPTSPDREKLEGAAEARTQRRDKLKHEQDTWREKEYAWLDKTERTFYSTLIKKSDDEVWDTGQVTKGIWRGFWSPHKLRGGTVGKGGYKGHKPTSSVWAPHSRSKGQRASVRRSKGHPHVSQSETGSKAPPPPNSIFSLAHRPRVRGSGMYLPPLAPPPPR